MLFLPTGIPCLGPKFLPVSIEVCEYYTCIFTVYCYRRFLESRLSDTFTYVVHCIITQLGDRSLSAAPAGVGIARIFAVWCT